MAVAARASPRPSPMSSATAAGWMLIPTPSGLISGAASSTVARSPRACSASAVASPPIPPPAITMPAGAGLLMRCCPSARSATEGSGGGEDGDHGVHARRRLAERSRLLPVLLHGGIGQDRLEVRRTAPLGVVHDTGAVPAGEDVGRDETWSVPDDLVGAFREHADELALLRRLHFEHVDYGRQIVIRPDDGFRHGGQANKRSAPAAIRALTH